MSWKFNRKCHQLICAYYQILIKEDLTIIVYFGVKINSLFIIATYILSTLIRVPRVCVYKKIRVVT